MLFFFCKVISFVSKFSILSFKFELNELLIEFFFNSFLLFNKLFPLLFIIFDNKVLLSFFILLLSLLILLNFILLKLIQLLFFPNPFLFFTLISGKISFTVFRYLVSKEVLEEEWLEHREKEPL